MATFFGAGVSTNQHARFQAMPCSCEGENSFASFPGVLFAFSCGLFLVGVLAGGTKLGLLALGATLFALLCFDNVDGDFAVVLAARRACAMRLAKLAACARGYARSGKTVM